ncbi:cobalamin 5'-phosphate synthase [Propionibacterium sp. oral taxon 192 str. F0372]|uniref:adenosylcobinamide-GDP ribazoletransferase n=1 Tax=Propionibacterium sp. oral taxon 192 TaxID=671222 RepID=UPI0003539F95|nr:adenosylcobinamide-GDP ribazoletransferase [Propionibacterium sp. oral taxon 192]EPH02535.1 cobalamin 5'-phosphate synthase [Propionibacterium sp. oral taxon 192 str. F0372]
MTDHELPPQDKKIPGLVLSAGFFTHVPMPPLTRVDKDAARRALCWMPVLGLLIGIAGGLAGAVIGWLSGTALLGAVVSIVVLQLLLGGMHLDGLADTFDGLAALGSRKKGRDATRALEIMKAPDIGAMGVMALVMVIICQVVALGATSVSSPWFLPVMTGLGTATGRSVILLASRVGIPPARPGGFGALFADITPPAHAVAANLAVMVLAGGVGWWLLGPIAAAGMTISVLAAVVLGWLWCGRIVDQVGGTTGDVFGALAEVCCALTWVGFAITIALAAR